MTAPSVFDNHLEKWIYDQRAQSVISVELRPNADAVMDRWSLVKPVPKLTIDHRNRVRDSKSNVYSTGFFIGEGDTNKYILTCAHALGPAFNPQNPIAVEDIDTLFEAWIMCDHREQRFERREDIARVRTRASFCAVDCANDLLVLMVSKEEFMLHCDMAHNMVSLGVSFPTPLTRAVMLSWPCCRNRTAVRGHISHVSRDFSDVDLVNPSGFSMKLAEVDITSEPGSSGAPLFNARGENVGVLHGGNGKLSYFIPIDVIRHSLAQMGWVLHAV